jgi:hypothetical protein
MPFSDTLTLEIGKHADNLPLTSLTLSYGNPCMESGTIPNKFRYTTELQKSFSCVEEENTKLTFDPRYTDVFQANITAIEMFGISEKMLYEEYSIDLKFKMQPRYGDYVYNY